jgi:hypothetical protein
MIQLRPHQIKYSQELAEVVKRFRIGYLFGEVRSGKTLTALNTAQLLNITNVLIVTKKSAIPSILKDYKAFGFTYNLDAINYESLHKISGSYDLIVYDESHSLSAYPKPSNRTKLAKKLFYNVPCILMTGTPAVESASQFYHQFYVSAFSPFKQYTNFYKWANDFVDKKQMKLPTHTVTDYSNAKLNKITPILKPYIVKMTQRDANFESKVTEHFIKVKTPENLVRLAKLLLKDKAVEGASGYILGDAPAKLQSKVHQLINGHCIIETATGDNFTKIFSHYKATFIKEYFENKKIVIMYFYQAELEILNSVFDNLATDIEDFNNSNKNIAVQQVATEGMNLSKADAIVYMNLGFSGVAFLQSRDRLTIKGRLENNVYFVCEDFGMTKKIVDTVTKKKSYNSKLFIKDYG